jgi:hypothetical protein
MCEKHKTSDVLTGDQYFPSFYLEIREGWDETDLRPLHSLDHYCRHINQCWKYLDEFMLCFESWDRGSFRREEWDDYANRCNDLNDKIKKNFELERWADVEKDCAQSNRLKTEIECSHM